MNAVSHCSNYLKVAALGIGLASPVSAQAPAAAEPPIVKLEDAMVFKFKQTSAINHVRQVGLALFEFEVEYGEFPSEKTAAKVKEATKSTLDLKAATADDCFRQLIAAKIMPTDEFMTLDRIPGKEAASDKTEKPAKWIFSYAAGATAAGAPGRPLAFYPLVQGKTTFDREPLGGKAVILFLDNSVRSFPIESDGKVLLDGKDVFDPAQPYWGGKPVDIKWPAK